MCGCEHHWDPSKPCTCSCPEHITTSWRRRNPELLWLGVALGVVGVIMLGWALVGR